MLDVQYQRCACCNGATLLFFSVWGLTRVCAVQMGYGPTGMCEQIYKLKSNDNQNFLDQWGTKFSKVHVWGSVFGMQEVLWLYMCQLM